jgi:hypothetical protein
MGAANFGLEPAGGALLNIPFCECRTTPSPSIKEGAIAKIDTLVLTYFPLW